MGWASNSSDYKLANIRNQLILLGMIVSFVLCKCRNMGNMFLFVDGKGHGLLKEPMMAKGDEGGTRVWHWIKGVV